MSEKTPLSKEDKITLIKKVYAETNPFTLINEWEEYLSIYESLTKNNIHLDTWMVWMKDQSLHDVFYSQEESKEFLRSFEATQVRDATLAWANDAPASTAVSIADSYIKEKKAEKEWESNFKAIDEEQLRESLLTMISDIGKRDSVEKSSLLIEE